MAKKVKHPPQPMYVDKQKTIRFKSNKIIEYLFEQRLLDLNKIAGMDFPREDRCQIAQLLGSDISSYGDLSYVTGAEAGAFDQQAANLVK